MTVLVVIALLIGGAWWLASRRTSAEIAPEVSAPQPVPLMAGDPRPLTTAGLRLVAVMTPDGEEHAVAPDEFRTAIAASDAADAGDESVASGGPRINDGHDVLWSLREIFDWRTLYFVDWKDNESFVQAVDAIAEVWGITVDWGVPDPEDPEFLATHSIPDLMPIAHASLMARGYALWNWDTEGDCYSGWISRDADAPEIAAIARALNVRFRPGDQPF